MKNHDEKRRTRKNTRSKSQKNTDRLMKVLKFLGNMAVAAVFQWLFELLISFL